MQSNHIVRREEAVRQQSDNRSVRAAPFSCFIKRQRLYHITVHSRWTVDQSTSIGLKGIRYQSAVLHLNAANVFPANLLTSFQIFEQVWIKGVTVRYVPFASRDPMSGYRVAICDGGSTKAVVRRCNQSAKLLWIPTEFCDHSWHYIADEHVFCSISVSSVRFHQADPFKQHPRNKRSMSTSGHIIVDVSATLRGRSHYDPGQRYSVDDVFWRTIACDCAKCAQVFEPATDSGIYSQTQILVDLEHLVKMPILYGIHVTRSRASGVRHPSLGEEGGVR